MTTLELFTKIKNHLLAQNERSMSESGKCVYRGLEGRMCAVGCAITNEHYDPCLEGFMAGEVRITDAVSRSIGRKLTETDQWMLKQAQEIHDIRNPEYWKEQLSGLERDLKQRL